MLGRKPVSTKGLRCVIGTFGQSYPTTMCNRPAKAYRIRIAGENAGLIVVCKRHLQSCLNLGYTLTVIDPPQGEGMMDYYDEGFPYTWLAVIGLRRHLTYCGRLVWFWGSHVGRCTACGKEKDRVR